MIHSIIVTQQKCMQNQLLKPSKNSIFFTSLMSEPRYIAESGVCSAGFRMIVHPAATAGATLPTARKNGKFHFTATTTTNHCTNNNKHAFSPLPLLAGFLFSPSFVHVFVNRIILKSTDEF